MPIHGKLSKIILGQYDLSPYLTTADTGASLDTAESTTFGSTSKTYVAGQADGTIKFEGFWDGGAAVVTTVLEQMQVAAPENVLIASGQFAVGGRCQAAQVIRTSYNVSTPVGDLVSLGVDAQVTNGLDYGQVLRAMEAVAATGNGSTVDSGVATTRGADAYLFVTGNAQAGTTIVKVQHSTDASTWVDLATFTTVAAAGVSSQMLSVPGTVNRYIRAMVTLGGAGAVTVTVALARL